MCRSSVNIRLSAIVVSTRWLQNRRKSQLRRLQNRFLGCFFGFRGPKSRVFDRDPLFRIPDIELSSWVMSKGVDSRIGASGDRKSTDHDTKSTDHDIKSTDHDIWRHFHDTSRHDAKVDLRRIVLDFLTVRIRVGEVETRVQIAPATQNPKPLRFEPCPFRIRWPTSSRETNRLHPSTRTGDFVECYF